jgi:transcriptional regulator with XRE-family HTH domain
MASQPVRLRDARLAAGLSQRALAERLGVPQPVIARWETGAREPRVRAAVRVAEALGTTANAIWPPPDRERAVALRGARPGAGTTAVPAQNDNTVCSGQLQLDHEEGG